MSKPTISIIVPIYNMEILIDRCVESLMKQTFNNIEIVLVNDGSVDSCPKICDDYAKKDPRIVVIHKENGGLSDARNMGLVAAKGDYILFVDSDDFIENDACEMFHSAIIESKYDIIVGGGKKIVDNSISFFHPSRNLLGKTLRGTEFLEHELKQQNISMASVLNLYKREFLIKNQLYFEKGLLHEDEYWTPRVILSANKVYILGCEFYNYIIRKDSISKASNFTTNAIHIAKIVEKLSKEYSIINNKKLKVLLNDYLVGIYLFAYKQGKLYKQDTRYTYRKYVLLNSYCLINRIKAMIFFISPRIYVFISNFKK